MKFRTCLLPLMLLFIAQGIKAQGVPQVILGNPYNSPGFTGDTLIAGDGLVTGCPHSFQYALKPSWFLPMLPQQGTITDIFFRLPRKRDVWPGWEVHHFDSILANSPLRGARIKMTIYNQDTIYAGTISGINCSRVTNMTTVFNTPVFYVPSALQGDDTANCWWKLPLNPPFSYNLAATIGENDTTGIRNLVIDFLFDSLNTWFDPVNNTSAFVNMWYSGFGVPGIPASQFHNYMSKLEFFSGTVCSGQFYSCGGISRFPAIGFNFAPNGISDVQPEVPGGVYPNPVGAEGRLRVQPHLRGEPYELYNLNGSLLQKGTTTKDGIDISALPAGMYLLHCGDKRFKVVKI